MLLLSEISWQQAVFTDISKVYLNDQFDYFKLAFFFFFIHQIHKMFVIVYIHYWNAWRSIKKTYHDRPWLTERFVICKQSILVKIISPLGVKLPSRTYDK